MSAYYFELWKAAEEKFLESFDKTMLPSKDLMKEIKAEIHNKIAKRKSKMNESKQVDSPRVGQSSK